MRWRRLLSAMWNMRLLGCLMVGPVLGLALLEPIFGLAPGLGLVACITAPAALAPFGLLIRAEYARLSDANRV